MHSNNIMTSLIFAIFLFFCRARVTAASSTPTPTPSDTTSQALQVTTDGLNTAKDIVTNEQVLDLFKTGSSFSILVYTVLAVLLIVVVLFGGITIYSMINSAKASSAFADAMKDTREFAENFAAYKAALDTNFDSLHDSITRLSTQTSRDFKAVFDRMAQFEKSASDLQSSVHKSISELDKTVSTAYTYCTASRQKQSVDVKDT